MYNYRLELCKPKLAKHFKRKSIRMVFKKKKQQNKPRTA